VSEAFVRELSAPRWRGGGYKDNVTGNPSWNDVEDAIRALNAHDLNDVYLEGPDDARMVIGGGAGRYLISVDVPDSEVVVKHFSPVNAAADSNELIELVVAGSLGEWLATELVDLDLALAAARSYYEDGTLTNAVKWERV
jgi:immunity protein Imm1 of predicted polymorphic toxin system